MSSTNGSNDRTVFPPLMATMDIYMEAATDAKVLQITGKIDRRQNSPKKKHPRDISPLSKNQKDTTINPALDHTKESEVSIAIDTRDESLSGKPLTVSSPSVWNGLNKSSLKSPRSGRTYAVKSIGPVNPKVNIYLHYLIDDQLICKNLNCSL